jgi:hypothetical protein
METHHSTRTQRHTWATITQTLLAALNKSMPHLTSLTVRFDDANVSFDSTPADDEVEDGDLLDVKLRFE